ncbi:MAG: peptide chain release factor N(5)-glutamine methyltransferase [Bacteroidales bacterium]|nr:peptide chain release factor N(5)-glutamine methyltransferase [Bacteroidales bacterium]
MNTRNIRFRSNRVSDILSLFHEELDVLYGNGEVRSFMEILFESFLGWDRVKLLTSKNLTVDQSDLLRFHWALEDLKRHRPIQHIVGYTDFCGCRIEVNPDVLIPRPETEEIVNRIIATFNFQLSAFNFLDLCTGSGCIAIALKKAFPEAEVTAVDVSEKALAVARRNAETNGVEIKFVQKDVLVGDDGFGQYGLIVSNPPYVRDSERAAMAANVLDFDPGLALFVPDSDPLRFYRAIAAFAGRHLATDGLLVLEINEAFGAETCALLQASGFSTELRNDFRGKPRAVFCYRNSTNRG